LTLGRKCGKLFCDSHTMYQMKLSMSAQWEPIRYGLAGLYLSVEEHGVEYAKHAIKLEMATVMRKAPPGTIQHPSSKLVRK
jgi:hypothetical protein